MGKFFIKNFIGGNQQGGDCIIKNTNAIKFRFSKIRNRLTASANEPLLIVNNLLGYQISYQLEDFYADFEQNTISYAGYPFFKEMQTKRPNSNPMGENRRTAYQLSMMHFVHSLYLHDLDSQGFTMKSLLNIENTERKE
jgi:hypothetical protein